MLNFHLHYNQNYLIKYVIVLNYTLSTILNPYCSVYVSVISLGHRNVHHII